MTNRNRLQFGYFKKPVPQEATILYNAAGNEIERVIGNINGGRFQLRSDIVKVVGGTSTKNIGDGAFFRCSVQEVIFPAVTTVGQVAFKECFSLTTANFPVLTFVDFNAFQFCNELTSISVPFLETIQNTAFGSCVALPNISLPRCTQIGAFCFNGCSSLSVAKLNLIYPDDIGLDSFVSSGLTQVRVRPAPNTPAGWTIGPGQTIGGKTNVTVVDDWTDWPN